jgi:methyl-accepting chemotaxis protein
MDFKNLKISTRLILGFGVLGLLIASMGGISLVKVNVMSEMFQQVTNDNLPKVNAIGDIKGDVNVIARAMRDIIMISDTSEIKKEVGRIDKAHERIGNRLTRFGEQITAQEGKAALNGVNQARVKYLALQSAVTELALGGRTFEAKAMLLDQLRPAQEDYFDALNELLAYQYLLLDQSTDATQAAATSMARVISVAVVSSLLFGLGMAIWIIRSIESQLGGEPGAAVKLARSVAAGELETTIELKAGDTSSLMAQLKLMQQSLAQVVHSVRQGSEGLSIACAEIAQGNLDLSGRTESQASALQQTAATMEQLGTTVKHNADSAIQASQLARNASAVAIQGGEVVEQVVQTMKGINDASKKIVNIISVIDSIAFQTNILALNAAVEAARAGEQGRGFAVVASEVRSLAGRSADAAKEIKTLINASVQRVEHGTLLVNKAGTTMTEVVGSIQRVADIMGEISTASTEQALDLAQVGESVAQMDQSTQQNAALVEQMASAASSLESQSQELVHTVAIFHLAANDATQVAVHAVAVRAPQAEALTCQRPERRAGATPLQATPRRLQRKLTAKSIDDDGSWATY